MPHNRPRSLVYAALVMLVMVAVGPTAIAQNKQGLGPGGTRLTPPPAPSSSGTGFGPNTGFGPSTGFGSSGSGGGGTPPGTRCVSIQCADGSVVSCNSTCPRPGAPSAPSSGGGGSGGSSGSTSAPGGNQGAWQAMLAANDRGLAAYKQGDFEAAARHFREALQYVPDQPNVRGNLQNAEYQIKLKRERIVQEQREAEATAAIRQGVERLANLVGTAPPERGGAGKPGLDFLREPAPTPEAECVGGRASVPNPDARVVDLRCAGTLTVDPGVVKGAASLDFAKSLDVPTRDAVGDRASQSGPPSSPRGIDRIEVPAPTPAPAEERIFEWRKLKDGIYFGAGLGEDAARWYADRYVAADAWYERGAYKALGWAASAWTPDTYVRTATTLMLAAELNATVAPRAVARAARMASPQKHVFLTREEFFKAELRTKNVIYHIREADGSVTEFGYFPPAHITVRPPAAAAGRAAASPPRHVFLSADEVFNIDVNARNVVYHIQHPDGTVKIMKWLVD